MGVCDWFKRISRSKRKKKNTPINLKIQQDSIDSTRTMNGYSLEKESGFRVSIRDVLSRSMVTNELAATRIQSAFRAYKARKTLRYLKGFYRIQDGLKKQASTALERLQFWSKIQAEISNRGLNMVTKSRIGQMKLRDEDRLKVESKLYELEMKWCGGLNTMVESTFKIQQREEASNKRERALAYAFSHQWRGNSSRYFGQAYYDLSKESWGWNWTERWIAVYRLEAHVVVRPVVSQHARLQKTQYEKTKMMVGVKHKENGKSFIF